MPPPGGRRDRVPTSSPSSSPTSEVPPRAKRQRSRFTRALPRNSVATTRDGLIAIGPFQFLLVTSWWVFWLVMTLGYLLSTFLFALLYYAESDALSVDGPLRLDDAFWFSVQTFMTIGYGTISPVTPWANVLATAEALFGLAVMTLGSGLLFVRVSRPRPHIIFSRVACLAGSSPRVLSIRVLNARPRVRLLDTSVRVSVLVPSKDTSATDFHQKRLVRLSLVRDWSASFAFPWTLRHVIDDDSPLAGLTEANVSERLFFVEAFLKGIDESYLQPVYMMHVFQPTDIRFDEQYTECVENSGGGSLIHLERAHETESWHPGFKHSVRLWIAKQKQQQGGGGDTSEADGARPEAAVRPAQVSAGWHVDDGGGKWKDLITRSFSSTSSRDCVGAGSSQAQPGE